MKVWQCSICKYIHKGENPPEKCPICGVGADKFVEINEADIPEKKPGSKPDPAKPAAETVKKPEEQEEPLIQTIEEQLCKHHAHPVSVHVPNGVLPVAVVLWVLAYLFSSDLLAKVAVINLLFVISSLPFVVYTGILEWQKKYNGALSDTFKYKMIAAATSSICCGISILWYFADPGIIHSGKGLIFLFVNIVMLAAAGIAGHIGGKLVFKD